MQKNASAIIQHIC